MFDLDHTHLVFDPLLTGEGADPILRPADLADLRNGRSVLLRRPGFDDVWLEPGSRLKTSAALWQRYVRATPVKRKPLVGPWVRYVAASIICYAVGIVTGVCLA